MNDLTNKNSTSYTNFEPFNSSFQNEKSFFNTSLLSESSRNSLNKSPKKSFSPNSSQRYNQRGSLTGNSSPNSNLNNSNDSFLHTYTSNELFNLQNSVYPQTSKSFRETERESLSHLSHSTSINSNTSTLNHINNCNLNISMSNKSHNSSDYSFISIKQDHLPDDKVDIDHIFAELEDITNIGIKDLSINEEAFFHEAELMFTEISIIDLPSPFSIESNEAIYSFSGNLITNFLDLIVISANYNYFIVYNIKLENSNSFFSNVLPTFSITLEKKYLDNSPFHGLSSIQIPIHLSGYNNVYSGSSKSLNLPLILLWNSKKEQILLDVLGNYNYGISLDNFTKARDIDWLGTTLTEPLITPFKKIISISQRSKYFIMETNDGYCIIQVSRDFSSIDSIFRNSSQNNLTQPTYESKLKDSQLTSTNLRDEILIALNNLYISFNGSYNSSFFNKKFLSIWLHFEYHFGNHLQRLLVLCFGILANIDFKLLLPIMIKTNLINQEELSNFHYDFYTEMMTEVNEVIPEFIKNNDNSINLVSLTFNSLHNLVQEILLQNTSSRGIKSLILHNYLRLVLLFLTHLKSPYSEDLLHNYKLIYFPNENSKSPIPSTLYNSFISKINNLNSNVPTKASTIFSNINIFSSVSFSIQYPLILLFLDKLKSINIFGKDFKCYGPISVVNAFIDSVNETFNSSNAINFNNRIIHSSQELLESDWKSIIELLPKPIEIFLMLSLHYSRPFASIHWPLTLLALSGRLDLCSTNKWNSSNNPIMESFSQKMNYNGSNNFFISNETNDKNLSDGFIQMEEISKFRFPHDDRIREVIKVFDSFHPFYVNVDRTPECSDTDYLMKLQYKLLNICRRQYACTIGRGFFTIGSFTPLMAETLPIPKLCRTGISLPQLSTFNLDYTIAPRNFAIWPDFHNACAAALRIGPKVDGWLNGLNKTKLKLDNEQNSLSFQSENDSLKQNSDAEMHKVTRNWIIYNKTASGNLPFGQVSHAGFLLALGLFGHLNVLTLPDLCEYLTNGSETTISAILIGASASKIGTCCSLLSRALCLHITSLLPPVPIVRKATVGNSGLLGASVNEIDVLPFVESSALIGLGLLFCNSGHRLISQLLLEELCRTPSASLVNVEREFLFLAAAWSLGMVLLPTDDQLYSIENSNIDSVQEKNNKRLDDLSDLKIEEKLELMIHGGKKQLVFQPNTKNDALGKSVKILEGDLINTQATSPGACICLALMYLNTGNQKALKILSFPQTLSELDTVRPDLFLYLGLSQCLVLGRERVTPSEEWIEFMMPKLLLKVSQYYNNKKANISKKQILFNHSKPDLDRTTALSLEIHLVSGICLGFGIIFAGTYNNIVKELLLKKFYWLLKLREKGLGKNGKILSTYLKSMIDSCLGSISLAIGCVMAGTGDIDCFRPLRALRFKLDDVPYGLHMALGMAIGFLFLGGGNYSFSTTPIAQAALTISVLPRFPSKLGSNEGQNEGHTQAWRHLACLAIQSRSLKIIEVSPNSIFKCFDNINTSNLDPSSIISTVLSGSMIQGEAQSEIPIEIEDKNKNTVKIVAPTLLPDFSTISSIKLSESNNYYYPQHYNISEYQQDCKDDNQSSDYSFKYKRGIGLPPLFIQPVNDFKSTSNKNASSFIWSKEFKQVLTYTLSDENLEKEFSSIEEMNEYIKNSFDKVLSNSLLNLEIAKKVCLFAID